MTKIELLNICEDYADSTWLLVELNRKYNFNIMKHFRDYNLMTEQVKACLDNFDFKEAEHILNFLKNMESCASMIFYDYEKRIIRELDYYEDFVDLVSEYYDLKSVKSLIL